MRRFCERCTEEDVPEAKSPSPLNAEQFTIGGRLDAAEWFMMVAWERYKWLWLLNAGRQ
ncbi:hypothetical protein [Vibrio vulnificus]|uniref:hypothetical protein n=1 Tax=Vibrio vulnificus TaxID=672 RepID=UPI000A545B86|nr:hypothetical protein [Vibrio vulnificus]